MFHILLGISTGTTSKAFGVPLTQLLTPPNLNDPRKKLSLPAEPHLIIHSKIPPIVVKIVEHIERNGMLSTTCVIN